MLPFHSGRFENWSRIALALIILIWSISFSGESAFAEKAKGKKKAQANASVSPGQDSLTNIPLPIGHEAKGLVLPDFDSEGHLRGKFEAGTARRTDQEHVEFTSLKIVTYTTESQPDLTIEMSKSVFNLKTRILTSTEPTKVTRADFNIVGDSVSFDTTARTSKFAGNVKMVITDQSRFKPGTSQ